MSLAKIDPDRTSKRNPQFRDKKKNKKDNGENCYWRKKQKYEVSRLCKRQPNRT